MLKDVFWCCTVILNAKLNRALCQGTQQNNSSCLCLSDYRWCPVYLLNRRMFLVESKLVVLSTCRRNQSTKSEVKNISKDQWRTTGYYNKNYRNPWWNSTMQLCKFKGVMFNNVLISESRRKVFRSIIINILASAKIKN